MATRLGQAHTLEVRADFACFSRPEMKVERFSYPCPTPSAARGIFEAIYFKPQFRWQVTQIELLATPAYIALRRNETKEKASERIILSYINGRSEPEPIFADLGGEPSKGRTLRQTMALREPRYRLTARIVSSGDQRTAAFDAQFIRRAAQGKCFSQPYLGMKEFVCFFDYIEDVAAARRERPPVDYSESLGFMIYDVFDLNARGLTREEQDRFEDELRRRNDASVSLFNAVIDHGVLNVPDYNNDAVLKPGRSVG